MTPISKARDTKDKNLNLICRSLQSRFRLIRYEYNNAMHCSHFDIDPCTCCSYMAADVNLVYLLVKFCTAATTVNKALKDYSMLIVFQEAAMQEKQAAQQAAAERWARVAEVEKQRKQQTTLLRKKTRSGQPIMKHRIDKLLETLQQ